MTPAPSEAGARADARSGAGELRPIFICGCQRSGTTLLAALLGRELPAVVTPESRFFSELIADSRAGSRPWDGPGALARVKTHWRFNLWDMARAVRDRETWLGESESAEALVHRIVSLFARARGIDGWRYWIDHTPENVRYGSTLAAAFPEARFVHIVRDGRAVAHSAMQTLWGPKSPRAAADWWTQRVGYGLALEQALGPRAVRVRYEDLVRAPERTLAAVIRSLGLERGGPSAGPAFEVPRYTARQHRLVNRPPDPSRVMAWRTAMHPADIGQFQASCRDFLAYLGYAPLREFPPQRRSAATRMGRVVRKPFDYLRWRVHRVLPHLRSRHGRSESGHAE